MRTKDIMTSGNSVHRVKRGQSLSEASMMMRQHKVSALPVVDAEDRVVGIVSERDLAERCSRECADRGISALDVPLDWISFAPGTGPQDMDNLIQTFSAVGRSSVDEVMTSDVVTAFEDDEVGSLLEKMTQRNVNHIPVIKNNGRLAGIVARGDVVTAMARQATSA